MKVGGKKTKKWRGGKVLKLKINERKPTKGKKYGYIYRKTEEHAKEKNRTTN